MGEALIGGTGRWKRAGGGVLLAFTLPGDKRRKTSTWSEEVTCVSQVNNLFQFPSAAQKGAESQSDLKKKNPAGTFAALVKGILELS